jgi:hypothetical protein
MCSYPCFDLSKTGFTLPSQLFKTIKKNYVVADSEIGSDDGVINSLSLSLSLYIYIFFSFGRLHNDVLHLKLIPILLIFIFIIIMSIILFFF